MNEPSLDPQVLQNNSSFLIEHQPYNGHPVVVRLLSGDDIFCTVTINEQIFHESETNPPLRFILHKPLSLIPAEMEPDAHYGYAPWQPFSAAENHPIDSSQVLSVSPLLPTFSNSYITWSERLYKALNDIVEMPVSAVEDTTANTEMTYDYLHDTFVEFDATKESVH